VHSHEEHMAFKFINKEMYICYSKFVQSGIMHNY
jgi:hypothetical protein